MSIIRSVLLSACLLCSLTLSAQRADKVLTNAIDGYLKNYDGSDFVLKNCRLERKRNNIVINKPARRITIYENIFRHKKIAPQGVSTLQNRGHSPSQADRTADTQHIQG